MDWVETYPSSERRPPKSAVAAETKEQKTLLSLWGEFVINKGILYRIPAERNQGLRYVVPLAFRRQVLYYVHRGIGAGHMGMYRTTNAAVRRFYWPNMRADIQRYVRSCLRCEMTKAGPGKGKASLIQEPAGYRNERIAFDIVKQPLTPEGYQCILCIGDYFTKYFVAVPLKNHTAPVVADAIVKEWVCKMGGCPVTIHSDRGPEFRGHVMKHMLEMLEIHQTFTTPYRPQSDGFVERFNRTLREMLATATNDDPLSWVDRLPFCMMAYNATTQASTGCTPNMLCFIEEATMPVDIMFGTGREERPWIRADGSTHYHGYVEYKRNSMVKSFAAARVTQRKAAIRQQKGYNIHLKPRKFSPGDWVLKWYKPAADRPMGRGWIGPYVVTKVRGDVVYEIQAHPAVSPQTVHVDHLKRCYAFEGKDNWVINPQYIPVGPPRPNQKDTDHGLDEILSQEGEDALDREALLTRSAAKTSSPCSRGYTHHTQDQRCGSVASGRHIVPYR